MSLLSNIEIIFLKMEEHQQNLSGPTLRALLNDIVEVHKSDMFELTGGHLNESKLWYPSEQSREPWHSSKKPPLRLKEPSKLKNYPVRRDQLPPIEANKNHMAEAVIDFMLGPSGGVGLSERRKNTTPTSLSPEPSFIDKDKKIPSDVHLTQELELPELMLPVFGRKGSKGKGTSWVRHEFITTHHSVPTKSDQFKRMKELEDNIIRKKDSLERESPGEKEIAKIKRRLKRKIATLEARHISKGVPSFYTLQVYSDCWDDLIGQSEFFGNILQIAKDEYEKYITLLLDLQEAQNGGLFEHLQSLTEKSTETAHKVEKVEKEVENLENQAMKVLQENERLKKKIAEEEKLKEKRSIFIMPDRSKNPPKSRQKREEKKDLEQQVEDLHSQIEDQLHFIEKLKADRSENYVPIIVCQRLEQCVKETELEIQKLLKQNDFLEKNIIKMEEELEDFVEESGTNERDRRMLWMKVNASHVFDSQQQQQNATR